MDQYVIRLWVPAPAAGDPSSSKLDLRGVVSHVVSGRSDTFRDGSELLRRLIDLRAPIVLDRGPRSPLT